MHHQSPESEYSDQPNVTPKYVVMETLHCSHPATSSLIGAVALAKERSQRSHSSYLVCLVKHVVSPITQPQVSTSAQVDRHFNIIP